MFSLLSQSPRRPTKKPDVLVTPGFGSQSIVARPSVTSAADAPGYSVGALYRSRRNNSSLSVLGSTLAVKKSLKEQSQQGVSIRGYAATCAAMTHSNTLDADQDPVVHRISRKKFLCNSLGSFSPAFVGPSSLWSREAIRPLARRGLHREGDRGTAFSAHFSGCGVSFHPQAVSASVSSTRDSQCSTI